MPKIFAANRSSVLVDGEVLEGLQTLHFQIVRANEDIHAIGSDERVDVAFGHQRVEGELIVRSSSDKLDALLAKSGRFQVVANLKKDTGVVTDSTRTVSFDDCFVTGKRFDMEAGDTARTLYTFTATRAREE